MFTSKFRKFRSTTNTFKLSDERYIYNRRHGYNGATYWYCDKKTFKNAPKVYNSKGQVYTVHGLFQDEDDKGRLRQETFPLVYAVLPDKRGSNYREMLNAINSIGDPVLSPEFIILDFEAELGYQQQYQDDLIFRNNIKLLSSLAFVPRNEVTSRFLQVCEKLTQEMRPLVKYFGQTYVGVYNEPTFSIEFWNLSDRILLNIPKTSNFVEGWHNKF